MTVVLLFGLSAGGGTWTHLALALAMTPIWLVSAKLMGLYDRDHRVLRHVAADELPQLATWAVLNVAVLLIVLDGLGATLPSASIAAGQLLCTVGLALTLRFAARQLWRSMVSPERVVIVGSGPLEEAARRKFELFEDLHAELVAVVGRDRLVGPDLRFDAELLRPVGKGRKLGIDRILIASPHADEEIIAGLMPFCRKHEIKLGLVPPARGMFGTAVQLDHIAELPIIQYNTWNVSRSTRLGKQVIDIVGSSLLLLALAPLMAVIACEVMAGSRGGAFYCQRRCGRDGKPFRMWKFRTMYADAEARLGELVELETLATPVFKLERDPRVTSFGRLLRRTSLDELPQLFNVLRGDMSLVGPRPEQVELVACYSEEARSIRLAVKPGLTGPMQIFGRGALTFEERLAVEREYVENLSVMRDLRILLMTLSAVVKGRGAY
ncbi:MAG: exopolysaccharide biosynthesis polyprenyl glycosylphosphotransferase [Solirubrobacterales bacterium]|nr:exopolysaccharide biosynthesis polyprenyl glycosylphosphotransferase [Solirubrobacterales bacterium]